MDRERFDLATCPPDATGLAPEPGFAPAGFRPTPGRRLRLALGLLRDRLGHDLREELDRGAGFGWMVVAFGLGALAYIHLPQEPWLPAPLGLALLLAGLAIRRRAGGQDALVLVMAAAVTAGLAAGKIESDRVAAPRLDRERTVTVTGWVEEAEASASGGTRMILRVVTMEARGRGPAEVPTRIAVTAGKGRDGAVAIGAGVKVLARLKPPDGPVLPGGYDFARRAWFEGRGASGYVLGRVEAIALGDPPLGLSVKAAVERLRHTMADRIRTALPGASGTIAAALIVGEARAIPPDVNDALRAAGLSHVISISGLHMTLVGGTVYALLRILFALVPGLALRRPVKKWAALAAFAAATFYLVLSGGGVATERSWVMFSVGLLAVMTDRPAVSLRTVSLSALIILAVQPHSVAEPSFLMSFLAVAALVAAYGAWQERPRDPAAAAAGQGGVVVHLLRWGFRHAAGLAGTSLVAGLATAPVVAAEFFRAAPYGLIANVIALPAVGVIVMPMALLAALLMPFGLEVLALKPMEVGIDIMVGVATGIAALPGGEGLVGRPHGATLPLAIAGILWLVLWTRPWRLAGLVPLVLAALVAPFAHRPAILVGADAVTVAVRGADGRLVVLEPARSRFAVATWLAADADPRGPRDASLPGGWRCDPLGCVFALPGDADADAATAGRAVAHPADRGSDAAADSRAVTRLGDPGRDAARRLVAVVRDPLAFDEDCRLAAVVITRLVAPPGCARAGALVYDRELLTRTGTVALDWPTRDPATGLAATPWRRTAFPPIARPWMPAAAAHVAAAVAPGAAAGDPKTTGAPGSNRQPSAAGTPAAARPDPVSSPSRAPAARRPQAPGPGPAGEPAEAAPPDFEPLHVPSSDDLP